jgi:hypothetical protein
MESLTVPGIMDSLDIIADYVLMAAKEAELDKKCTYKLRLAVDEIATNIVVHAYEEGGCSGDIFIESRIDKENLTIIIEDTASPFDPSVKIKEEMKRVKQPLENRPIGGLGIFLVIDGVDDFDYQRIENKNRNIFVVKRDKAS